MADGDRDRIKKAANDLKKFGNKGSNSAHEQIKKHSRAATGDNNGNSPWCACTVSVVFYLAGLKHLIFTSWRVNRIMTGGKYDWGNGSSSIQDWINQDHDLGKYGVFKTYNHHRQNKQLLKSLRYGDLVIYKRDNSSHIGIFVSYDSKRNTITNIEGNKGDYSGGTKKGALYGEFTLSQNRMGKIGGFVIPRFNDNTSYSVVGATTFTGDNKQLTTIDPRIVNTNTELSEQNISSANKIWSFYTSSTYKNYQSQVPTGLNPVKKTLGTDTNSIRDMSVMKNNGLGYVIGRALETWDSIYNYDYGIVNNEQEVSASNKQLVFNRGNKKWYFANGSGDENSNSYKSYDNYLDMNTPFNLYFGKTNNNQINWNSITTPEKLLIHIVKKNSIYSYEPAYLLLDENDVTKGFKRAVKNIPNDKCEARPGAIAVWANGSISSNKKGMIIGFVEKVKSNNRILVSWSNAISFFHSDWLNPYALANSSDILNGSVGADTRNRLDGSGIYFWGYIYPPEGANIFQNNYFLTTGSAVMNWTTERMWVV